MLMGGSSNTQHIPHRVYICSISHITHNTQKYEYWSGKSQVARYVMEKTNKSLITVQLPREIVLETTKKAFSKKPST